MVGYKPPTLTSMRQAIAPPFRIRFLTVDAFALKPGETPRIRAHMSAKVYTPSHGSGRISRRAVAIARSARAAFEAKVNANGGRDIWLDPHVLNCVRGPGESYCEVILRLAARLRTMRGALPLQTSFFARSRLACEPEQGRREPIDRPSRGFSAADS
jgi:hypothetical protein